MLVACSASTAAASHAARCNSALGARAVSAALAEIEDGADPCGESRELAAIVAEYRRCGEAEYPVCVDRDSERSFIEQGDPERGRPTMITWNPRLRSELEPSCGGDPSRPVLRDPTASLLHEIVHAVQDCAGLDPAEHELEAVRVENIYRRARGLCQRTRYGPELLPASMMLSCEPGHCLCRPVDGSLIETALPAAGPNGGEQHRQGDGSAGDTKER